MHEIRTSTDAEADRLFYYIDWADGSIEEWIGPYDSGQPIYVKHNWSNKGTYEIKAMAKDECGAEGGWGTFTVKMPRYSVLNNPLILRLLKLFPILEKLL